MLNFSNAVIKRSIVALMILFGIRLICCLLGILFPSAVAALHILSALYYITLTVLCGFSKKLRISRGVVALDCGMNMLFLIVLSIRMSVNVFAIATVAPHTIMASVTRFLEDLFLGYGQHLPNWCFACIIAVVYGLIFLIGKIISRSIQKAE